MRNNTNWKITEIIFVRDTSILNTIHRCCVAYIAFLNHSSKRYSKRRGSGNSLRKRKWYAIIGLFTAGQHGGSGKQL